jgi:hypothetical protein
MEFAWPPAVCLPTGRDGQAFSRGEYVKLSFYILKLRLKRLEVASFKAKISSEPDALAYKLGGL